MSAGSGISRRQFLKASAAAGAGLVISIYLPACNTSSTVTPDPAAPATDTPEPTATPEPGLQWQPSGFLRIDDTGTVTIILHKCELGQGVGTTLPMVVAEELDVDWSTVSFEQVPAANIYGKTYTSGSDSTSDLYSPLRIAGATARTMLLTAAAQTWGVDREACHTELGAVVHGPTEQRLAYGELVEVAAALPTPRGAEVIFRDPSEYRIVGTRLGRRENPQIVDGSAVYGIDVQLPGMLYAAIARSPVYGGSAVEIDASQTSTVAGVRRVIQLGSDSVAVVADSTWAALQGRRALQITWDEGRNAALSSESILQELAERVGPASDDAENTLQAFYQVPFLAHVTPEPMNCVADVRDDRCEVWAPTQNPGDALGRARAISGLSRDDISVHIPLIGGGFGRRLQVDYVEQAVQLSQTVGSPVKVVWTREDDIQHDYFHPYSYHLISASLDDPNRLQLRSRESSDIPTGAWRAATNIAPAFVEECFMDEVAVALGRDPYELRLDLPRYSSLHTVLEIVATNSGWGTALPEGWGRGIACYSTWNVTPTAHVVEVSVDNGGNVRVHRVVTAIDCGMVLNPDIVEAQMEGGIVMGLTAALKGEITLENGRVQQSNLHDYPLLRIDEMPVIEVTIVPSEDRPSGVGEMAVPPIIPAVANAIYAATGKRVRRFPIRPEDLREA